MEANLVFEDRMVKKEINCLEQAKIAEINDFISNCLRVRSEKTGKLIKINTFKWSKAQLVDCIRNANYENACVDYINKTFRFNLEIYRYVESSHKCKYCGKTAEGTDEDILCPECQALFGHKHFSEL